ncbi:MAG: hypothetical protein WC514_02240 [Candidatus Paceibacterota bacterium]
MKALILEEKGQIVLLPDGEEEEKQLLRFGLALIKAQYPDRKALLPTTPVQSLKRDCHRTGLLHLTLDVLPFDELVHS